MVPPRLARGLPPGEAGREKGAAGLTNQEKKEYLRRYKAADEEINDLLREKERVMSRLTRMTASITGMPKGGGERDALAGGMDKLIALDREIDCKVDALITLRREIEGSIANLGNATQRRLLRLRYLECMSWNRVAVEMGVELRWVYRIHGRALTELTIVSH